jgi:hypothetical protein
MKFNKILKELYSEEKARLWVWLAKFDGKEFVCSRCSGKEFYQHTPRGMEHFSVSRVVAGSRRIFCATQ